MMTDALITTKVSTPPPRVDIIQRESLLEKLDRSHGRKLTVVSAPAGFGKTTLLSNWASNQELPLIWYSLDEGDNDAHRFLLHFVYALDNVDPSLHLREKVDAMLQGPGATEALVQVLTNELDKRETSIFIVLDDYHVIHNSEIDDLIRFMLDHFPSGAHFLIASRTTPSFPIAKLRADGQLLEINSPDLRFGLGEIAQFMRDVMGIDLPQEDFVILENKTEGWPAGLLLTALSLEGREDPSQFIASLSGSHRYILDYLTEEVFGKLPQVLQLFLLRISPLARFHAAICDVMVGDLFQSDSIEFPQAKAGGRVLDSSILLEFLEDSHLFVFPLDHERKWYRFHPLFSEFLNNHLQDHLPQEIPDLHRRAADWFSNHGFTEEAIHHALSSNDNERAADLIAGNVRSALSRGETKRLIRWIEKIPRDVRREKPALDLALAWSLFLSDSVLFNRRILKIVVRLEESLGVEGERILQRLAESTPGSPETELMSQFAILVAYLRRDSGDPEATIQLFKQALASLAEDDHFVSSFALSGLASTYGRIGKIKLAESSFADAAERGRLSGSAYAFTAPKDWEATMQALQGELNRAADSYRQAIDYLSDLGLESLPLTGHAFVGLADIIFEKNELDDALTYAQEGIRRGVLVNDIDALREGYLLQARILNALGDEDESRRAIERGLEIARKTLTPSCLHEAEAWEARIEIARGEVSAGTHWAAKRGFDIPEGAASPEEIERKTYVRLLMARGNYAQARELLDGLLQSAESLGFKRSVIECLTQLSVAQNASGQKKTASVTLSRALLMAEPEGYVRTFLEGGPKLAAMLKKSEVAPEYRKRLLTAFGEGAIGSALIDPLTERELEILSMMAQGLNNADIAAELVIALSTVKTHINHIYGKLGVTRRTQAIATARDLDLIQ
jgi:LuxR family maltose regulon positive regulatory protein